MTTLTYKIPKKDIALLAWSSIGGGKIMLCGLGSSFALALLTYFDQSWMPFPYAIWLAPTLGVLIFRYFLISNAYTDPQFSSERKVDYDDRHFQFNIPTGTCSCKWADIEYLGVLNGYHHLKTSYPGATHQFIAVSSLSGEEQTAFHDQLAKSVVTKPIG